MYQKSNTTALIKKYENMLASNEIYFFDVDQFEEISEHYYFEGDFKRAIAVLDMARNQHPQASTLLLKRAQCLVSINKLDEAARELEVAESIEPNSEELMIARANLFSKKGHHGRAIRALKAALEFTSDPFDVLIMLANEYQIMGKLKPAISYYQKALEVYPDDENSHLQRCLVF
jgi:tetratricopeptide (TPR) repeat protein